MELGRGSRERIQETSRKIGGCSEGRGGGGGRFEEQAQVGSSRSFTSSHRTRGIPFSPCPMSPRLSFICWVRSKDDVTMHWI